MTQPDREQPPGGEPGAAPALPGWDELAARLARRPRRQVRLPGFRESAVLVPLIDGDGAADVGSPPASLAPELLYIVRTAGLANHAGQIAFPGGKREQSDSTLTQTALREAAEEVGIAEGSVRILGTLDDVATPMGFVITPVVGVVRGPLRLRLQSGEVAESFTAEIRQLSATYHVAGHAEWLGYRYTMHEFRQGRHRIWGATAAITLQLLDLMTLLSAPPRDPEAIR